jgi:hypothetical protein
MVEHLACGVEAGWEQRFAGRRLDVRTAGEEAAGVFGAVAAGEEAAWVFRAVEGFIWRWGVLPEAGSRRRGGGGRGGRQGVGGGKVGIEGFLAV